MLNKCIVMGRMTKDPELRRTGNGTPVTSFSLACDRDFKDKQSGEKATDFIDVVAWRNTAEFVSKYFGKGRMVVAEGRLQIREWMKDGQKRRSAEILADNVYFADSRPAEGCNAPDMSYAEPVHAPKFAEITEEDGELPF